MNASNQPEPGRDYEIPCVLHEPMDFDMAADRDVSGVPVLESYSLCTKVHPAMEFDAAPCTRSEPYDSSKTFEQVLDRWKGKFTLKSFIYADSATSFKGEVRRHFGKTSAKVYGVYIVRERETRSVLYIGKGGTVNGNGHFKGQDVPRRLRNTRGKNGDGKDVQADQWFRELCRDRGPLLVEYLALEPPVAPAYAEAVLLQAYLFEYKRLPPKNRSL
jgi:hypothetical protein